MQDRLGLRLERFSEELGKLEKGYDIFVRLHVLKNPLSGPSPKFFAI